MSEIYVVKRDGKREEVHFEKVQRRIKNNSNGLNVSSNLIAQKVCSRIYDGVSTEELDELTAEICTSHLTEHPDYETLAKRIIISNNHKTTPTTFSESTKILYENDLVSKSLYDVVMENEELLNSSIKHENDYLIDYFGFKTLQKSYLQRVKRVIVERPQYLFMRVSLGLHLNNVTTALKSYLYLSHKNFIHATPTLFHSGTNNPQLLSCFLLGTDDSVSGIYKNISDCAQISKWAGGLGVHMNNIRGKNARIHSSNGYSNGIIPMLRVYNETAKYINQCFAPETNIQVFDIYSPSEKKEIVKPISKIDVGDLVMTIDCSYKKVLNVIKNTIKKEIYYISNSLKKRLVRVTGEHQIYIKRGFTDGYFSVSELIIGDLVCYPDVSKYLWYPINYIEKFEYEGDVYDLTVEENHSYVVDDLGLVHNSGKRNGSIAVYLEPHHPDIMDFLELRKNNGSEDMRTRDLFLALMIPDLFMRRVEEASKNPDRPVLWSLFDPNDNKELIDLYGDAFDAKYAELEANKKFVSQIDISKVWKKILSSQIETGTPYILFKDQINKMSNQSNVGTIKSSNLCAEIVEYSDANEYACCCLASISLGELVARPAFDQNQAIIFAKTDCIYCSRAIQLFEKIGIKYKKVVLDDDEARHAMYADLGAKYNRVCNTVPQILLGDTYIGGYTDFVEYAKPRVDYGRFEQICDILVRNLNRVIDINYYPVPETERSNFKMRPLGIGVQGFTQMLLKMGYSFESNEAKVLNKEVFEAMQYYCLKASCAVARERKAVMETVEFQEYAKGAVGSRIEYVGDYFTSNEVASGLGAYERFRGSPLSEGIFQHEKYGVPTDKLFLGKEKWDALKVDIMKYGVRNSLLVALMPTASTSQILGNTECFEPITSNIYTRRTLAGDFVVLNRNLVDDLLDIGLWSKEMKDKIIAENGSIANISVLSSPMKEMYKTVWEIKQKTIIDLCADRAPFICQTQSMNLFFEEPKIGTLGSALIYGWKRGLKTGSYYIRSRPKIQAQQFTIDPKMKEKVFEEEASHICESCSG
jgi:ribonucleotide reductase alpha subunit